MTLGDDAIRTADLGAVPWRPPVKRSVTIAGHQTSISLEPLFWDALETAASARGQSINALVAAIDAARIGRATSPNLTSAIRQWLWVTMRQD